MSFTQGFTQGFGMVDRLYQHKEDKRRYDEGMGLRKEEISYRRDQDQAGLERQAEKDRLGLERQKQIDQMDFEKHEAQMGARGLQNQLLEKQVGNYDDEQAAQAETRGLQNQVAGQRLSGYKSEQAAQSKDRKRQDLERKLGVYAATGDWATAVKDPEFKDTDFNLITNPTGTDTAIRLADSISNQDWGAAVSGFNTLFKPKLNRGAGKTKGKDGGLIRDVSATNFEQQEDGSLKIKVNVTTDKGVYSSYISELRSSDENDPAKNFSVDGLLGTASGLGHLAKILKSSGIYDQIEGSANRYLGSNAKQGQSQIPAQAQNVKYMAHAMGIPEGEAWELTMRAKSDPNQERLARAKFVSNYVNNNSLVKDGMASPEERAAIQEEGIKLFDQLMSNNPSTQGNTSQEGGQQGQHGALMQQAQQAIASGKDRNAVIQRLVELGVPQDQIKL